MARTLQERLASDPFSVGEVYFSSSQRQLVTVADMPLPYARNVMVKLLQEHGEKFFGSELHLSLYRRLVPTQQQLRSLLASAGEASIWAPNPAMVRAGRSKLKRAGKAIGRTVETSKSGEFVAGICSPVKVNVRVKGRAIR